ncbi:MAG: Nif3-like dinuclear metal center hexameric protein [Candidatus Magasanikbacteria bacterium]|nr:Nif3-like dinuclear metal center hexameric protein [Candidatus Magasanikbacteria bacterium]
MQADRKLIVKFCEEYLKVKDFEDYCVNGMQVEGKDKVKKIVTGVSFSQELIEAAIVKNADMIIVHHGIFIYPIGKPPVIKGNMRNRLKLLLENDINLLGFHLPLDAHPVIGNNISLCNLFGVKKVKPFAVGFCGELEKPMDFKKFSEMVAKKLEVKLFTMNEGAEKVKRVGIISGGSSSRVETLDDFGIDTFICGDIKEDVVWSIKETKINFINAGHYNTEKLGVQNLGKLIAKKFKVDVEFIDIPCEV